MKHIKTFDKFNTSINEMFDDENLKNKSEIAYLSDTIDKKALANPSKLYTNRIHNLILSRISFFKKANIELYHDLVVYRFGTKEKTLAVVIEGALINDKYHTNGFKIHFYIEENNICLNPNDAGDIYDIDEMIEFLNSSSPIIEKEFGIMKSPILN